MTQAQLEQRINTINLRAVHIFKDFTSPVRTGTLKGSFKDVQTDKGVNIYTDLYYMPYTNEPWLSPKWNGRENPNLYWFERQHEYLAKYIARHLGGRYVRTK